MTVLTIALISVIILLAIVIGLLITFIAMIKSQNKSQRNDLSESENKTTIETPTHDSFDSTCPLCHQRMSLTLIPGTGDFHKHKQPMGWVDTNEDCELCRGLRGAYFTFAEFKERWDKHLKRYYEKE